MKDAVNYGIGHKADRGALYYLNPGTPCNHASPNKSVAVVYHMDKMGEMELWTVRDVKAGEELLIDYKEDYVACDWYDTLCNDNGLTPLSKLGFIVDAMYTEGPLIGPLPKPWENRSGSHAPSFSQEHPTEFRSSMIEGAGTGWWAKADIPAGVMLRRVTIDEIGRASCRERV